MPDPKYNTILLINLKKRGFAPRLQKICKEKNISAVDYILLALNKQLKKDNC